MSLYESISRFDTLYRRAFWKKLLGKVRHHHLLLPLSPWREIAGSGEEIYKGIQTVPIDKIIGTENRFDDFDREFLPLKKQDRHRWARIHQLYQSGQSLPVVSLVKVGEFYFVRDGHHRISVAKAERAEYIDAEVIEIPLPPTLQDSSPEEVFHRLEEQIFWEKTGLKNIHVTIPGGYLELLRLIQCFQCSSCISNAESREKYAGCIPWEEAVQGWYKNCYQKATEVIQESKMMRKLKNRTPTDFYLWMLYNLDLLRKEACFIPSPSFSPPRKRPTVLYRERT